MNLQQLWSGNDYAYTNYSRPRGVTWIDPKYVERVRIVRTFKKTEGYNDKATGFAEVLTINGDGEPTSMVPRTIRATRIIMRWEEYEEETYRRKKEQEERVRRIEEENARRREELEARRREREQQEEQYNNKIHAKMGMFPYTFGSTTVCFNRDEFDAWLEGGDDSSVR